MAVPVTHYITSNNSSAYHTFFHNCFNENRSKPKQLQIPEAYGYRCLDRL